MAKAAGSDKITVTHPVSGTKMKLDASVYTQIKEAIIECLKGGKVKTFTILADDVKKIIKKKIPDFRKSVSWYTITIRLDLETRGIMETFLDKGKKLNRLRKKF